MKSNKVKLEHTASKLSREQLIAKLKQLNLKGGRRGNGCPPPNGYNRV